jgi:hypothetical protein
MTGADQLREMREGIEALTREARALYEEHGEEKMEQAPAGGGWSAAECLSHLALTVKKYLPGIDGAIAKGREENIVAHGPFSYGWMSRMFVWMVGPPARMKVKAPKGFEVAGAKASEALEDFLWQHEALMGRMDQAAGLDLEKLRVVSPVNAKMKFELGAIFLTLEAHGRRHMEQARRALAG